MTTTATVTPQVWIGCLASYNAGRLIGEWVEATDIDELYACQARVAAKAVEAAKAEGEYPVYFGDPEEFFLADNEGFGGVIGEYEPYERLVKLAERIEEHGAAFVAYLGTQGRDDDADGDCFEERYRGEWECFRDFAYELVAECGWAGIEGGEAIETIAGYLDWGTICRDLRQDYSTVEADGTTYVFDDNA